MVFSRPNLLDFLGTPQRFYMQEKEKILQTIFENKQATTPSTVQRTPFMF
jgi:hypothetical protein